MILKHDFVFVTSKKKRKFLLSISSGLDANALKVLKLNFVYSDFNCLLYLSGYFANVYCRNANAAKNANQVFFGLAAFFEFDKCGEQFFLPISNRLLSFL